MAIFLVGAETVGTSSGPSMSVDVPVGTTDGDFMMLIVAYFRDNAGNGAFSVPTGWVVSGWGKGLFSAPSQPGSGSRINSFTAGRVASSEPSSYTIPQVNPAFSSPDAVAVLLVYRGLAPSTHVAALAEDQQPSGGGVGGGPFSVTLGPLSPPTPARPTLATVVAWGRDAPGVVLGGAFVERAHIVSPFGDLELVIGDQLLLLPDLPAATFTATGFGALGVGMSVMGQSGVYGWDILTG